VHVSGRADAREAGVLPLLKLAAAQSPGAGRGRVVGDGAASGGGGAGDLHRVPVRAGGYRDAWQGNTDASPGVDPGPQPGAGGGVVGDGDVSGGGAAGDVHRVAIRARRDRGAVA
jgi:hypothetical protein